MAEPRDWTEEIRIAGNKAAEKIKELIREGNVRKIIIKKGNGEIIREIPMTHGVAIAGLLTLVAPILAVLGALLATMAEVKIEVVRTGDSESPGGDETS